MPSLTTIKAPDNKKSNSISPCHILNRRIFCQKKNQKKSRYSEWTQVYATRLNKSRFRASLPSTYTIMRAPGTQRQPLGEVSPNTRRRIVGARDHGIKFTAIGRMKELVDSTCRTIYKTRLTRFLVLPPNVMVHPPSL